MSNRSPNGAEQMTSSKVTATGVMTTYTYAGASQSAVLLEATAGGSTYNVVYGKADQKGNPTITQYKADNLSSEVFSDPVTGQALMLTTSTGTATIYIYDGTGSPTYLLTDTPSSAWNQSYDPYGTERLNSGDTGTGYTQNPYSFKGGIQDRASDLVKFGQRWYNPTTGTWTQQDTLDAPLDPKNANRYQYAGGDPINGADPSGRIVSQLIREGYGIYSDVKSGIGWVNAISSGSSSEIASQAVGAVVGGITTATCAGILGATTAGLGAALGAVGCAYLGDRVGSAVIGQPDVI